MPKPKSQRMIPVNRLAEKKEQASAVVFSQCMSKVREMENQLETLYSYRAGYHQQMTEMSRQGVGSNRLQDTLVFMHNLNQSIEGMLSQIKQQKKICENKKQQWLALHTKTKIYTKVTDKYISEEQIIVNKNEQKLLDEFNQSSFHRKLKPK
ncbi:MAG: flagellar export protein FliJ [Gammaproteobacteria bacterium]|nr:flagellar export protein FliJ [Gammaproteobacteria bacterium]